ncbi:MAG: hypothetical protein JWN62_2924 [Acidimicrobiales bacterium]|nr:hypothetical protein [Acidimicrobiales bacterium]
MRDGEPAVPLSAAAIRPPRSTSLSQFESSFESPVESSGETERFHFRSGNWLLIVAVAALLSVVMPAALIPMLTIGGTFTTGKSVPVGLRVWFVVWLVLGLFLMYRMIRTRVVVTDDALIVYNPAHTRRLQWDAIDHIDVRKVYTGSGASRSAMAKVRVYPNEGEAFRIAAASVYYRTRAKALQGLLGELAAHGVQVDDVT